MEPQELGQKYNKIAGWWQDNVPKDYGVKQFKRALELCSEPKTALDIGCGAGGRFIDILAEQNIAVTGIDVSEEMLKLARQNHPEQTFLHEDICTFETEQKFDFIWAWDSIFHLPYASQKPVITKMCQLLNDQGVLLYSFGNGDGEHQDSWHNDTFHYSSIGINGNIEILQANNVICYHLEADQYPDLRHFYLIGIKNPTALSYPETA